LYAASVDDKELSQVTLTTIAAETMWDAVLTSVLDETAFAPPATPPTVGARTLHAGAGTCEFGGALEQAGGSFGGLGLDVAIENGLVKVSPIDGAPAARAGVVDGDIVTRLDGAPLEGLTFDQVVDKMRGPPGTTATLAITRKGQDRPIDIKVVREQIRLRSLLRVRVEGGSLSVEAIGGRQVFEFRRGKPVTVIPLSDSEFYLDGRYHTRIAFTKGAGGKISGAVLNPGRREQKGVRID
jgi:PDZ domain